MRAIQVKRARVGRRAGTALALSCAAATPAWGTDAPANDLARLADGAGDVVVFDEPRPPAHTRIVLAAAVRTDPESLRGRLSDIAFYRAAVPWFVRADVRDTNRTTRFVDWELEVPLWNLEGKLRISPQPAGVVIELVEGDLAPGRFVLSALPAPSGAVLVIEARANVSNASFVTRRLASRHPLSEPAMTATAAYVLLRALALEAARPSAVPSARWPRTAIAAPATDAMANAAAWGDAAWRSVFARGQVAARVRSRTDGRLDHVSLAFASQSPVRVVEGRIADARSWRALPGWTSVDVRAAPSGVRWEVDSSMPFVDFDSVWSVTPGPPFRARALDDDWSGAALRWDVLSTPSAARSIAVLSFHGRVDTTGLIPRRLIAAEPLLEHGLSLGLAYVDGAALLGVAAPRK